MAKLKATSQDKRHLSLRKSLSIRRNRTGAHINPAIAAASDLGILRSQGDYEQILQVVYEQQRKASRSS